MTSSSRSPVPSAAARSSHREALPTVCVCFLLSGFAALLYQTAWMRQFSIYFGTSEYAVATVLAAYMAGLALGAGLAGRFLARITRPVLVYGILEAAIAISALCVPLLLKAGGALYAAALGDQPEPPDAGGIAQPLFYLIASMITLVIPTACMGATLPILMRHVIRSDSEIGKRTGLLYGINTFGAVLGTIAAAFVLLPALGMNGTVWVGVGVNLVVFAVAAHLARSSGTVAVDDRAVAESAVAESAVEATAETVTANLSFFRLDRSRWLLPVMTISGSIAFVYEVLWTRLLVHVLSSSVTAFSTMLAAFLAGIAIGGGLGGAVAQSRTRATWAFVVVQLCIGLLSAFNYLWIDDFVPGPGAVRAHALLAALVLLPSAVFIGATFPLAVRALATSERGVGSVAARVFAWNTVGAIAGAIAAAFFVIPSLGFQGTIVLCVSVNLALAAIVAGTTVERPKIWATATLALLVAVTALGWRPGRPDAVIQNTVLELPPLIDPHEILYRVGRSSTVLVLSSFPDIHFRSNGLPESSVLRKGAGLGPVGQLWLGAMPALLRPGATDMLVVGLGGGGVLEAVPDHVRDIDVIELEPEVIAANRAAASLRQVDPLQDPRIEIIVNDARNALRLTNREYDIIVSQPSHPWTAGASHLFTKEYLALAKRHLREHGVLLQWMNAAFVDAELLRDLVATLLSEFRYVIVDQPNPLVLHLHASDSPLEFDRLLVSPGVIDLDPSFYARLGINHPLDGVATFVLDNEGASAFAKGATVIRDDDNRMATRSRPFGDGLSSAYLTSLLMPHEPLSRTGLLGELPPEEQIYLLGAIARFGMPERARALASTLATPGAQAMARSIIAKYEGDHRAAASFASRALESSPHDPSAHYLAMRTLLESGRSQAQDPRVAAAAAAAPPPLDRLLELRESGLSGEWEAVGAADDFLAQLPLTRAYAPLALRLRAEARIYLRDATPERWSEAMAFIERAQLLEPTTRKLQLRFAVARRLGDSPRLLDSLWLLHPSYAFAMAARRDPNRRIGPAEAQRQAARLDQVLGSLRRISAPEEQDRRTYLEKLYQELRSQVKR